MRRKIFLRILSLVISVLFGIWIGGVLKCNFNDTSIHQKVLLDKDDATKDKEFEQRAKFNRGARKHSMKSPTCCAQSLQLHDLSRIELSNVLRHVIVDRKNKLLYCYVPKVASSNMKRLMLTLQGRSESADAIKYFDQTGFEFLRDFSANVREHMLKTYYKFLFVRDPLDRLVSAYRNKFLTRNTEFRYRYGRRIVEKYRKNNSVTWRDWQRDMPTFQEFVRYTIHVKAEALDEHWIPFYNLCQPCAISYDFVGSFENLGLDVKAFLKEINATKTISFPRKQTYYESPLSLKDVNSYYEGLTATEYRTLRLQYRRDFSCFSYPFHNMKKHIQDNQ